MSERPEEPKSGDKEAWADSVAPPALFAPVAAPTTGAWVPPPPEPPPAPAPPVAPLPAPPARDPAQTLHLERSPLEEAVPPPAAPAAPGYERTMVLGTFTAPPKLASLSVRSGPDTGAQFMIETSPLYIGRAPDNGVVVNDPATSRRHARFEVRGQDYLVVDLGSANGTLVDGARVVEQVLVSGSVVTMGQNQLLVTIS